MKLEPVTKTNKKNKITSKKVDHDFILVNCKVIVFFSIHDQFGAIWKSDSVRIVCKTYFFIKSKLLF